VVSPPGAAFQNSGVGLLGLLLLIPLAMVQSTLTERHARYRAAVVGSIAQTWGGPQRLLGPVFDRALRLARRV